MGTTNQANLEDYTEESCFSHLSASPAFENLPLQSSIMAAKSQENSSPIKVNEKILPDDNNQKVKIGRSVSLSKINTKANGNDEAAQPQNSKRKTPDHPSPIKDSPKGNLSAKETKAKFENKLQEKYRNQRNMKDTKKDANKFKGRACKKTNEVIEDPLAKMIRDMHADVKEMKQDQKKTTNTIKELSLKLSKIEKKSNENDLNNKKAIKDINNKVSNIEDQVTTKLLAEIEPSLNGIKTQIEDNVNQNLRRIVQEELMLQKMAESKSDNEDKQEDEDEKNKKIQKKVKKKNQKKIEDEEGPSAKDLSSSSSSEENGDKK